MFRKLCIVWLGVLLLGFPTISQAWTVTLGWTHPQPSQVLGFNVWWKSTSQDWNESRRLTVPCLINTPGEEQEQSLELTTGIYWCVAVTAFDDQGNESSIELEPFPIDTPSYLECMWIDTDDMKIE